MFDLTNPIYHDKDKAREHLEATHWPNGPVCPRCHGTENIKKLEGKSTRPGVYKCNPCRKPFTVTVGTIFEDSKIPLNKWLLAFRLMAGSKKGISAHQLHRSLNITYKSAWFMAHRIREAMRCTDDTPMGGPGCDVEADETYFGRNQLKPKSRLALHHMNKIVALVDRTTGRSTSVVMAEALNAENIGKLLYTRVDRSSRLLTDEANHYKRPGKQFAAHESVNHQQDEYVRRSEPTIHTNTVEGFFGIFKRGMRGIYQHCAQQHLQRYLAEFDFRYSNRSGLGINDAVRTDLALKGAVGKRLTYRQPHSAALA